jgi:hypothetical protein
LIDQVVRLSGKTRSGWFEELQYGMEALVRSIQAETVIEGLARMAKEVEKTYKNSVVD